MDRWSFQIPTRIDWFPTCLTLFGYVACVLTKTQRQKFQLLYVYVNDFKANNYSMLSPMPQLPQLMRMKQTFKLRYPSVMDVGVNKILIYEDIILFQASCCVFFSILGRVLLYISFSLETAWTPIAGKLSWTETLGSYLNKLETSEVDLLLRMVGVILIGCWFNSKYNGFLCISQTLAASY